MQNLADRFNVVIVRILGVAGHEKGLIEAISSFGVKSILRGDITTLDKWFSDSKKNMWIPYTVWTSVQIRSYFWFVISCIQSEYWKIWTRNNSAFGYFSYSRGDDRRLYVHMCVENLDQKQSAGGEIPIKGCMAGHLFVYTSNKDIIMWLHLCDLEKCLCLSFLSYVKNTSKLIENKNNYTDDSEDCLLNEENIPLKYLNL